MKNPIKIVKDGFKNIITKLGTNKDARYYNEFIRGRRITIDEAENLYVYNWLAAQVADAIPDDATREWRSLLIPDADEKKKIEDEFKTFGLKGKINLAMKWARVFGGSAIIIVIEGEDPIEPLNLSTMRQGSLKNLIVLDRYNLFADVIDRDIMSDNYGQPEFYTVVRGGQRVHHTRVVRFDGVTPTIRKREEENFWGLSIYTKLFSPIADSQITSDSISNLITESNIDVYRIAGLNQLVAEGNDAIAVKRLKLAHSMKSVINGIALDKEDEYDKKTNTFTTLPDIDDRFIQKVAGASDIPVTRLLGTSPAGENATGESDLRNYYDKVSSLQENEIRPRLDYLDQVITTSIFGSPKDFEYKFLPLQQLTESEQAVVDLNKAQRDQIYLDLDIIQPTDAMAELAENGTYVSIDASRVEEEKLQEEDPFGENNSGDKD